MALREISMDELKQNNGEDGNKLWVLIAGNIYDVTNFKHPGGKEILLDEHGQDREDEFESIHSPATKTEMKKYLIGTLKVEKTAADHKKTDGDNVKTKNQGNEQAAVVPVIILMVVVIGVFYYLFKN